MYIVAVLYPGGALTTVTATRYEGVEFIRKMKERLLKANERNAKGYVFQLPEAAEVIA